jgi:hypothetical protein
MPATAPAASGAATVGKVSYHDALKGTFRYAKRNCYRDRR